MSFGPLPNLSGWLLTASVLLREFGIVPRREGSGAVLGPGGGSEGCRLATVDRILESPDRFTQPFPKLRKLSRPEHEQGYPKDHEQVHRLKEAFKHGASPHFSRRTDPASS